MGKKILTSIVIMFVLFMSFGLIGALMLDPRNFQGFQLLGFAMFIASFVAGYFTAKQLETNA